MVTSIEMLEYLENWMRLCLLVDKGEGESEEADNIRDKMDGPWYKFSEEEIKRVELFYDFIEKIRQRRVSK